MSEKINLKRAEEIVFVLRQHPWFFGNLIFLAIGFLILNLVGFYFLGANEFTWAILILTLAYLGYKFLLNYYCWRQTKYILTNKRIITSEQKDWLKSEMRESDLANILYLSHNKDGVIDHLFERGTIHMRTSGAEGDDLVLTNVTHPYDIEQKIAETKNKIED